MTRTKTTTLLLILMCAAPAAAQMDNVVDVEHTYKPELKDANKINVYPEVRETKVNHYKVDYALNSLPLGNYTFSPMWAAKSDVADEGAPRNFVTLGGGTEGNLLGRMATGIEFDRKNSLGIDLGLRGRNAYVELPFFQGEEWTSRFYTASAAAGYEHRLTASSSILVDAAYESQVFNYLPGLNLTGTDKQHNSIATFSAGLTPYRFGDFAIGAEVGYEMFSQKYSVDSNDKYKEGVVTANAAVRYDINASNGIGLDFEFLGSTYSTDGVDGYSHLALRPHYRWTNGTIDTRVGVYVGSLGIAPDVSFTYHYSPRVDIYANVGGGSSSPNTFRAISSVNPYWMLSPLISNEQDADVEMKAQFDQLAASAGLRLAPVAGLSVDVNTGYELSADRMELAYGCNAYSAQDTHAHVFFADGNRFFVNLNAAYSYKDRLTVRLDNQFNAWTIDEDNPLGVEDALWRPVFDLDWRASFRIISGLRLGADFRLQTFKSGKEGGYSRPTTADLSASLSYTLPQMPLTLFVKGDNLLNRNYDRYIGYRAPGINILGGAAITF